MRRHLILFITLCFFSSTALPQSEASAAKTTTTTAVYSDRASFLDAVGDAVTDDYAGYGVPTGNVLQFTNAQMSNVLGETGYESTSFIDFNLVGDVYAHGDGTNYCAGCNGNFRLWFDGTSVRRGRGVFGVAVDILLHTSRRTALGDVDPGETSLDGTILVEFGDGEIRAFSIPADVGFFGLDPHFVGLTDRRGIRAMTFGTEPLAARHSWVIDSLTIAAAKKGKDK